MTLNSAVWNLPHPSLKYMPCRFFHGANNGEEKNGPVRLLIVGGLVYKQFQNVSSIPTCPHARAFA